jgi:diaminopimelate decarboxylase/aspartate kinase
VFVYDEETLARRIRDLHSLDAVDRVLYAVKANWHPELLEHMHAAGFGFECVSVGELDHLWEVFGELDSDRVLFTPNFAPREEYEAAFDRGVHVTLDNLYPLAAWPEVFKGRRLFVRLDPGKGRGHHKHVHTAGVHSKFGIPPSDLEELVERARSNDTHIVGLHAHTGSGILAAGNWSETALFFSRLLEMFPEVEVLDLGGGLGVVEKPGQIPLDLAAVGEKLRAVKEAYPDHRLWLEPGRFLAAEAGVLLARITQVKGKGETRYVGVDVGMNTLIRPALYGAYHEIVNLSKLEQPRDTQANVVGFICESGDTFGHARRLANPQEGDILLIATAGAYGRTMSSHYNLRPPAREVFLEN